MMIEAIIYVLAGVGALQIIYACLPVEVSVWILEKAKRHLDKKHTGGYN